MKNVALSFLCMMSVTTLFPYTITNSITNVNLRPPMSKSGIIYGPRFFGARVEINGKKRAYHKIILGEQASWNQQEIRRKHHTDHVDIMVGRSVYAEPLYMKNVPINANIVVLTDGKQFGAVDLRNGTVYNKPLVDQRIKDIITSDQYTGAQIKSIEPIIQLLERKQAR